MEVVPINARPYMMHRNRKPRPRQTTSRSTLLESLETRRLMSTITFNGTSGNDSFVLKAGGPNDVIVYNGQIASLRRFKDDVAEVRAGLECGVTFESHTDIKPGDFLETYEVEMRERTL